MASWRSDPSTLSADRVEEGRVALEFGEPERRAQAPHHRVHHVGDDVVCVVELDAGEKAGVAGDIGDHETGGFGFRKHFQPSLSGAGCTRFSSGSMRWKYVSRQGLHLGASEHPPRLVEFARFRKACDEHAVALTESRSFGRVC